MKISTRICVLVYASFLLLRFGNATNRKQCHGTNSGFSRSENQLDHLRKLESLYTNCTVVNGNLEITGLSVNVDLSFIQDIEVVTGYVLIAMNELKHIPIEKLKIIRGQELFNGVDALHVSVNINREYPTIGLERVGFKALTEIQRGNVNFIENHRLCYVDTRIDWSDILDDNYNVTLNNTLSAQIDCPPCHESCDGKCWGPTADDCQILTKSICDSSCGNSRCRGPGPGECCHRECASGCTGPTDADCLVCRQMNNDGICQAACPTAYIYDRQKSMYIRNPDVKYHLNGDCVDKCPKNMLVEENGCVKHCRSGNHNNGEGVCVKCVDDVCNKECFGVGNPESPMNLQATVDADNVKYFEGCNIVRGNIVFQAYVFTGDPHTGTLPLTTEQMYKAFSSVKVINGHLQIMSWHQDLHDFSVFSNLTTIRGIELFRDIAALVIQDSTISSGPFHLSQITSLGFRSLKSIDFGNVYIGFMNNLCSVYLTNWTKILRNPIRRINFENGALLRNNARSENCSAKNVTCHAACDDNGCWGPGDDECLRCKKISFDDRCVLECDKQRGVYQTGRACLPCDSECDGVCDGEGPMNCTRCKHFGNDGVCVPACPSHMYGDLETRTCMPCNVTCLYQRNDTRSPMCSGPSGTLGPGGCTYCYTVMADRHLRKEHCLPRSHTQCPRAHYAYDYRGLEGTERVCVPCISGCRNCSGSTEKDCLHALPHGESAIVMSIVILVVFVVLVVIVLFLIRHKRMKDERERQKSMRALGLDAGDVSSLKKGGAMESMALPEPMTPSGVAPNKAQLRIVKETELRIGKILGTGAFGTVHKGYWIPDLAPREKVRVPVAIKVLRDESSRVQNNEILDEAFVMASCEHPNLVQLLGISLSHKTMLITQLMPLGNLLEYVRDNKDNIGSQNLLNWCLQISRGMCYLAEEKHLVHRDLAARNVLVKSPNHVRITDFGLAKLLDVNQDVYRAEGGKMPIKWLALESIQHRIFTQKSDVWSFGVTVWELMTYGKKPYENVPAREVYTLLERGERLLQPTTCTIDIYMLMIKCWTVDPDSRPTFRELIEEFSKMARDPQRYLVIPNDGSLPALPSPTNSEFFRTLKNEEYDDFPLRDAEEYLQPGASRIPIQLTPNGAHFPLQPAPTRSQRRRHQVEPKANGYPSRFVGSQSTTDSRLDSTFTVMTSLPSDSSSYPNGCSTPFGASTSGSNMTPDSTRQGFPAFGRLSNRSRDRVHAQGVGGHHYRSINGPRTNSDSSDVFITSPASHLKDVWETASRQPLVHEQPTRARENSATMRYSAEPGITRQESRPNADESPTIPEDKDGYLEPTNSVAQNPEYLDAVSFRSTGQISGEVRFLARSTSYGMENPDYEPAFPSDAPSSCILDRQLSKQDDDGYEIPLSPEIRLKTDSVAEYVNTKPNPVMPAESAYLQEDASGYLMVNATDDTERRNSNSGESTSSGNRDSGVPSDGDEGLPLNPKNVKAAGGICGDSDISNFTQSTNPAPSAKECNQNNIDNSVNNPNYELLENMTDGGFAPMSEFVPKTPDPWVPANNHNSDGHPFQHDFNNGSPARVKGQRNPLQLTIDCSSLCEDIEDNIFVTPESQRRGTANVKNLVGRDDIDELYDSPEQRRRGKHNERVTDDFDEITGHSVPRTYSEPDSGVGIEFGIDNTLYHRLGSFGCEGGD